MSCKGINLALTKRAYPPNKMKQNLLAICTNLSICSQLQTLQGVEWSADFSQMERASLVLVDAAELEDPTLIAALQGFSGCIGIRALIAWPSQSHLLPQTNLFRFHGLSSAPVPEPKADFQLEIALASTSKPNLVSLSLSQLGIHPIIVPDTIGFAGPRVLAMVVNEAHLVAEGGIASHQDIDTSMRYGTNYPMGPFEWEQYWGQDVLKSIMQALNHQNPTRYLLCTAYE